MQFQSNFDLAQITSFHIGGPADYFAVVTNLDELREALHFASDKLLPVLILGAGSNSLISDVGFRGLAIQINFRGLEIVEDNTDSAVIKAAAGEVWDDVVAFAVNNNLWGIENLSYIPGRTGGVPMQNVGAYGTEASETILRAELLNIQTGKTEIWQNQDFAFGYRKSRLNQDLKNKFVVLSVYFRLSKTPQPNLLYVDLKNYFAGRTSASLIEIRQALGEIRGRKFPKISEMGSDGSFFKNLILSPAQVAVLDENVRKNFDGVTTAKYEEIKSKFPVTDGVKVPTAFLIDICGLKGTRVGGAMLWDKQPLVIVNAGNATAADIANLFRQIRRTVYAKTGMALQPEPEWIGFTKQELENYFSI